MKYLKVNLWGHEIGRLVRESATRRTYFMYNPEQKGETPDIAPLLSSAKKRNILLPIYGDERPLYQGLPPFIADSLPDSWGNTLFDRWVKDNKIPRNKVTPLYKLTLHLTGIWKSRGICVTLRPVFHSCDGKLLKNYNFE